VAIITGGGRGLGRAFARALAAAGASVALISRSEAELEQTAAEIASAGGQAISFTADVTDKKAASGKADALTGCFLDITDDLATLVDQSDRILQEGLHALRLRKLT
jgi:NAD(P)-dependent dehydrogenase (short-subunit alcohol dehydrogenase family)